MDNGSTSPNPKPETVKWYLDTNGDMACDNVHIRDANNRTPLINATLELASRSRQIGAAPKVTPSESTLYKMIRTLLKHNADVNAAGNDGRTALSIAMDHGPADLTAMYLEQFDMQNSAHRSPRQNASKASDAQNSTSLIEATYRFKNADDTQLIDICDTIRTLLKLKADVNAPGKDGLSALSIAIDHNLATLVQLYLENGSEEDTQEIKVSNPLYNPLQQSSHLSVQNNNNQ
jgi:ankyrin repeat protein